jgi:hypothetical protein
MRLNELKHPKTAGAPYLGTLTDAAGDTHYELAISGPPKLIEKTFAKTDFEYGIEPKSTETDWVSRYQEVWTRSTSRTGAETEHETVAALEKAPPAAPDAKNSIVVSTRRTEGRGTWWWWALPVIALPAGANLFFVLPPICNCAGVVAPISGDPDLFLSANGPRTPILAASMRGAGLIDRVAFGPPICWPWQEFVPWFRINAFSACVTSFSMTGFGVVP